MRDKLITKSAKYLASNPQERCKNTCFLVRHQTWSWERISFAALKIAGKFQAQLLYSQF